MVSRAIIVQNREGVSPFIVEEIIHTGTGMHGEMTGRMLAQIEEEIITRKVE